jgi:hypothetical protein
VAKLPGRLYSPPLQFTAGDDACAKAGRRLEHQQVVVGLALAAPFGQRDHVGVVVQNHRRIGQFTEVRRQRHAVPAAHHR